MEKEVQKFNFEEIMKDSEFFLNFKKFCSSNSKGESELMFYEQILEFEKLEKKEEKYEKSQIIFHQFFNQGLSFYFVELPEKISEDLKKKFYGNDKKNFNENLFDETKKFIFKEIEKKYFPLFLQSKDFQIFFKDFKKKNYSKLPKILNSNFLDLDLENLNERPYEENESRFNFNFRFESGELFLFRSNDFVSDDFLKKKDAEKEQISKSQDAIVEVELNEKQLLEADSSKEKFNDIRIENIEEKILEKQDKLQDILINKKKKKLEEIFDFEDKEKIEKKNDIFIEEKFLNLQVDSTTFISKYGKEFINKNNLFFCENDFLTVNNEFKNIKNFNLIKNDKNYKIYVDNDFSHIENPNKKFNKIKIIGELNYNIEKLIKILWNENNISIYDENFKEYYQGIGFVYNNYCASSINYGRYQIGFPNKDRQFNFCSSCSVFEIESKCHYFEIFKSINSSLIPKIPHTEYGTLNGYFVFEKIEEEKTKYYFSMNIDFKGFTPKKLYLGKIKKQNKNNIFENIIEKNKKEKKLENIKEKEENSKFICLKYFLKKKNEIRE